MKEPKKTGLTLFKPGQINNPNGRPKGVANKITNQMKQTFANLFEDNKDRIQDDLNELDAKDRMKFWIDLMPYFTPKLTAVKAEITTKETGAEQLSSIELTQFILGIAQEAQLEDEDNGESTDTE
jgi:hypothetical protein